MRVLLTFKHEGRVHRPGDDVSLPTDLATEFAARGLVAAEPTIPVDPKPIARWTDDGGTPSELAAAQTMVATSEDRVDLDYPVDAEDDAAEDVEDAVANPAEPRKRRVRHK